jgi:hypothetical protein
MADEMDAKGARLIQHKMYRHIHDDRVTCSKCEGLGYLAALNGPEVKKLVKAIDDYLDEYGCENGCDDYDTNCDTKNLRKLLSDFKSMSDGGSK